MSSLRLNSNVFSLSSVRFCCNGRYCLQGFFPLMHRLPPSCAVLSGSGPRRRHMPYEARVCSLSLSLRFLCIHMLPGIRSSHPWLLSREHQPIPICLRQRADATCQFFYKKLTLFQADHRYNVYSFLSHSKTGSITQKCHCKIIIKNVLSPQHQVLWKQYV